jgi:ribosomal protein S18 acetylase RimI-like enzyme
VKKTLLSISTVRKQDIGKVLRLWREADMYNPRSDTPEALWRKAKREKGLFLVAKVKGKLAGTVMGGYDGRVGTVQRLVVSKRFRRQGIGEAIMMELERRLRRQGAPGTNLLVFKENKRAIALYKKLGFEGFGGLLFMKKRLERSGKTR